MPLEPDPSWICSQLGAREHYSIPRALSLSGKLAEFHTDLWSSGPWSLVRSFGAAGRDLAGRYHAELRGARIFAYPLQGIPRAALTRFTARRNRSETELHHAQWFDRQVKRHHSVKRPSAFFSYTGSFLQTAQALRDSGALRILGQVDPAGVEEEIVQRERSLRPGWEPSEAITCEAFRQHRSAEWEEADLILVNSAWCRDALVRQGVQESKLRIVPLAYESPLTPTLRRRPVGKRLRVLWLGQVILRKGIHHLIDAAQLLEAEPIDFTIAGPAGIAPEAIASAPGNVRFIGPVSRSLAGALYEDHDLFVLPTLSDGFAITQLEAMAHGLPVVATPCCGEVVEHERNGYLIPPADAPALADAIRRLAREPELIQALGAEAVATSKRFGLDRLAAALIPLGTAS